MNSKKIVFLTGTRADFGKIKSLISVVKNDDTFEEYIFVTGMHLQKLYGYTLNEILACGFENITTFPNHTSEDTMDLTLAKTIEGFSNFVNHIKPDLIVVHGDRVEALAGAIVGALNNILVAHIEGGEVSGTIDELIRHSVSKLSHIHFVSNEEAKKRLLQMGELETSIKTIGSPDLDLMFSEHLPDIDTVKDYYKINFGNYSVCMFHPVTTEFEQMELYAKHFVDALLKLDENFVVIYPNNDLGNKYILQEYKRLKNKINFKTFPSIRFEYFLTLLKNANSMIGNSSAGVREAPYYGIPTINIGSRQNNRVKKNDSIFNTSYNSSEIINTFNKIKNHQKDFHPFNGFGNGKSDILFHQYIQSDDFWKIEAQKKFIDLQ